MKVIAIVVQTHFKWTEHMVFRLTHSSFFFFVGNTALPYMLLWGKLIKNLHPSTVVVSETQLCRNSMIVEYVVCKQVFRMSH